MHTLRLAVDPLHLDTAQARAALDRAAEILRSGGLVALPTETVYGLGANALDPAAVARIFTAKQRPSWDPVIVHIAAPHSLISMPNAMLDQIVASIPDSARRLIDAFWPGPLTLLLPRSAAVPDAVTAGRPLVGIRMPAHPVALQLIRRAGIPVAAPSANMFSRTSPTTADHVLEDLDGRIDAILDSGPTAHGVESTVLDPGQSPMLIYRPGAVTAEQIRSVAGPVETFQAETYQKEARAPSESPQALPSPGVGMRHYAPRARLVLIEATPSDLPAQLARTAALYPKERVGIMLPAGMTAPGSPETAIFPWGRWAAPEEMAHSLYAGLRALDGLGCTIILCPMPPAGGVGDAIRDRLRKAARAH
ncbi:MAG TPA: L-threonylcarbamoyladenylate synthase [Terracidiphilus sp.]